MPAARPSAGRPAPPASDDVRVEGEPVDIAFLVEQTGGDRALERDVLHLFLDQARRLAPRLSTMTVRERSDSAHLLKGSCRGIGAWAAAAAAAAMEDAPTWAEPVEQLCAALVAAEAAILARLASS